MKFWSLKHFSRWVLLPLTFSGALVLAFAYFGQRQYILPMHLSRVLAETFAPETNLGHKHHLNYQQWVDLLGREAQVVASKKPANLAILLGDSISLWFPAQLLPTGKNWLNQGISGETTSGLLQRLYLLDNTKPQVIFVMIGINDLLRGTSTNTIVANQRLIVRHLRKAHPQTKIILQSILPHSGEQSTWERRDLLLETPNVDIQTINRHLKALAHQERIIYLDLYALFADNEGKLRTELSSDGLHLNEEGYKLWRIALQICSQLEVDQ